MKQARISVIFGPVKISYLKTIEVPASDAWSALNSDLQFNDAYRRLYTLAGNTVNGDIIHTRDYFLNFSQTGNKYLHEFSIVCSHAFIPGLVLHKSNIATFFRAKCLDDAIKPLGRKI